MITKKKRSAKPKEEDLSSIAKGIDELIKKRQWIYDTLKDFTLCSVEADKRIQTISEISMQIKTEERKYKRLSEKLRKERNMVFFKENKVQ